MRDWEREALSGRPRRTANREPATPHHGDRVPAQVDQVGPAGIRALQRTVGNRGVVRLLERQRGATARVEVQRAPQDRGAIPGTLEQLREDLYDREGGLVRPSDTAGQQQQARFPKAEDGSYERFPNPVEVLEPAAPVVPESSAEPATDPPDSRRHTGKRLRKAASRFFGKPKPEQPPAAPVETGPTEVPAQWVMDVNSQHEPGNEFDRNCIDAARAFLATWYGSPTPAAGVFDQTGEEGPGLEVGGPDRTAKWLQTEWRKSEDLGHPTKPEDIEAKLMSAGHGAAAIVVFQRADSDRRVTHAVNVINHDNKIYWVDAQKRRVGPKMMYEPSMLMTIVLNGRFDPVDEPVSATDPFGADKLRARREAAEARLRGEQQTSSTS